MKGFFARVVTGGTGVNGLSMMTATRRNYIQCLPMSRVICRHVTIFSENFLIKLRKLSQSVLIIQLYLACSPQTTIRQEEEGLPFVPDDKVFISIYCFLPVAGQFAVFQRCPFSRALYRNLNLHPTTTLFPKVLRGPIVAHSPLFEFKTPHISKFSWSWVKRKINKV